MEEGEKKKEKKKEKRVHILLFSVCYCFVRFTNVKVPLLKTNLP